MFSLEGDEIFYALKFKFKTTNNQVEYEALIVGLKLAHAVRVDKVKIRIDSHSKSNLNESF